MKEVLFFMTDRYPYSNSEAFIENEISYLAERFDQIYIIPTAMCCDTRVMRSVPVNVSVLSPACSDDLFLKPFVRKQDKINWFLKHLLFWGILSLFTKEFHQEIMYLRRSKIINAKKIKELVKSASIRTRNKFFFSKECRKLTLDKQASYFVYSYWLLPGVCDISEYVGIKTFKSIVARAHRFDIYSEQSSCNYIPFQQEAIEYVDFVYPISRNGYDYLSQKYKGSKDKIISLYLGTTDHGVEIEPQNDTENFLIVSCSNLIPVKRVHLIVQALDQIKTEKNIRWIHFGDGAEKKYILNQVRKLLHYKNISCEFKGQISNDELIRYYQTNFVNLFINVSESEGLPVSIMEAMSFGIPIIATDVGGTKEAMTGRENFLLRKDFVSNELTVLIETVLSMKSDEYRKLRVLTREEWEKLFDAGKNYKEFTARM